MSAEVQMSAEVRVDTHAHIWGPAMPFWSRAWKRPDYAYTVETYLDTLDASGVDFAVIAAASLFGTYNDYVIRALRQHRRLRGTVIVDPEIGMYDLECMRRDGVVGVRLQLFHTDLPDFAADGYNRLFHRLRDMDMHVHVNVEAHRLPSVLDGLRPSGVKVVIDHFGWPDAEKGLDCPGFQAAVRACQDGMAWVKLSGGFRRPDQDIARLFAQAYVERVGTERLFWGSDAPFVGAEGTVTHRQTLDQLGYWLPDAAVRAAIHRSAHDFYFA
ncbi:amidohydrolase family protein [Sphingobium fuliginis]|uniref:Putative 2-pyrone-4,6-dicarboxylic acid hydrolase n=1 Tax=Sphingobium fuliginis (strain ATCC 27551) TaxID=336203 RepID=A0A292ZIM2_SPHSA|nr:amidohydrolase family protein [Sphingobium fuliginis]GAY24582.1 putative 2-pyrone-4,6-dicarboxylic acid hydrolase [Sphingobium fuliginis]